MKRLSRLPAVSLILIFAGVLALADAKQPEAGPLTGTWTCMSHGTSQGDMPFTLYLTQDKKDDVTGSVSSPIGSAELASVTFDKKNLEIKIDTPQGTYTLSAKYKKDQLIDGSWNTESGKGTWEGKKSSNSAEAPAN